MAKQVTTKSGTVFKTITAAKDHFNTLRKDTPVAALLSEPERSDVIDIYHRYCRATGYPALNVVDVTTVLENEPRTGGSFATTKAFAVIAASGEKDPFSILKALSAIAV